MQINYFCLWFLRSFCYDRDCLSCRWDNFCLLFCNQWNNERQKKWIMTGNLSRFILLRRSLWRKINVVFVLFKFQLREESPKGIYHGKCYEEFSFFVPLCLFRICYWFLPFSFSLCIERQLSYAPMGEILYGALFLLNKISFFFSLSLFSPSFIISNYFLFNIAIFECIWV